jgi:hypothetical protein
VPGPGGDASAAASARSGGGGLVQAAASSFGGGDYLPGRSGGSASASATALNSDGEALTTASAPNGYSAGALTNAAVGSGSEPLVALKAGQAVSDATLTPRGPAIGIGAMSAAYGGTGPYGGTGQALDYEATAVFDFTTTTSAPLYLNLVADKVAGIGFGKLELKVIVDGAGYTYTFSSLAGSGGAEPFFTARALELLGSPVPGSQSVKLEYFVDYNSGNYGAAPQAGFGFTYNVSTTPVGPIAPLRP